MLIMDSYLDITSSSVNYHFAFKVLKFQSVSIHLTFMLAEAHISITVEK